MKDRSLRTNFGKEAVEWKANKLIEQDGKCAICGTDKPGGMGDWHLDHDHAYPKNDKRGWRGLLCHRCNFDLGVYEALKADPRVEEYLRITGNPP